MIGNLIVNFFTGRAVHARARRRRCSIAALIVVLLVIFRQLARGGGRLPCVSSRSSPRTPASCAGLLGALGGARLRLPVRADRPARAVRFNANKYGTFPFTGWTMELVRPGLRRLPDQGRAHDLAEGGACEVTLISTIVGTAAAFPLVRSTLPFRSGVRIGMTLPIMIPGLLIGVSACSCFLTDVFHMQLSPQTAVIGQAVYMHAVRAAARRRAAAGVRPRRSSGRRATSARTRYDRLRYVVLPLIAPAIFAGALFAFTLSLDEFIITLFLIGGAQHAADLHLHAGEVRDHARGERARDAAARRVADADRARVRAAVGAAAAAARLPRTAGLVP